MSGIKCIVCNRPLKNENKAIPVSGGFAGPSCIKKVPHLSQDPKYQPRKEPDYFAEISTLVLSEEERMKIYREIQSNERLKQITGTGEDWEKSQQNRRENIDEVKEIETRIWNQIRNLPSDPRSAPVLFAPIHPTALKSVDIDSIKIVGDLRQRYRNGYDPNDTRKKKPVNNNNIYVAIHSFCKLFNDPSLPQKDYELFQRMELRLFGVAPTDGELSTFIITSDASEYPERGLAITVFSDGWIGFRCVEITKDGIKASMSSDITTWPLTLRRSEKGDTTRALVAAIFLTNHPDQTEVFKKVFTTWSWNAMYREHAFTFKP